MGYLHFCESSDARWESQGGGTTGGNPGEDETFPGCEVLGEKGSEVTSYADPALLLKHSSDNEAAGKTASLLFR